MVTKIVLTAGIMGLIKALVALQQGGDYSYMGGALIFIGYGIYQILNNKELAKSIDNTNNHKV